MRWRAKPVGPRRTDAAQEYVRATRIIGGLSVLVLSGAIAWDLADDQFWFHHTLFTGLVASLIVVGVTVAVLNEVLERRPKAKGAGKLRLIFDGDAPAMLSKLERGFRKLLIDANLPLPEFNRAAGGRFQLYGDLHEAAPCGSARGNNTGWPGEQPDGVQLCAILDSPDVSEAAVETDQDSAGAGSVPGAASRSA